MGTCSDITVPAVPASDSSHWFKVAAHYELALKHIGRLASLTSTTLGEGLGRQEHSSGPWKIDDADADECLALVRAIEDISQRAQVEFG